MKLRHNCLLVNKYYCFYLANNELGVCEKAKAEGPCDGDIPSWFYNKESGECEEFSFSGCMGNNNR